MLKGITNMTDFATGKLKKVAPVTAATKGRGNRAAAAAAAANNR